MRKNLGNDVISALFVIHRCGIRNKPRLNLISTNPPPPPPISTPVSPLFLSLSFLLSYLFYGGGGGGGGSTAWEAKPFRPPDLLLPPFLFFFLFFLSLSLLFPFRFFSFFLSFFFFFFFFFLRGGGAKARSAPPPWIRGCLHGLSRMYSAATRGYTVPTGKRTDCFIRELRDEKLSKLNFFPRICRYAKDHAGCLPGVYTVMPEITRMIPGATIRDDP